MPVALFAPTIDPGSPTPEMVGARTVTSAVLLEPPTPAVSVTGVFDTTGDVGMVTDADVAPDATVTCVVAMAALLLAMETAAPPAGAADASFTVAVTLLPPLTAGGDTLKLESVDPDTPPLTIIAGLVPDSPAGPVTVIV